LQENIISSITVPSSVFGSHFT